MSNEAPNEIDELVEKSVSTDVKLLIQAKETAKKRVKNDPSAANLRALDYATSQLEKAIQKQSCVVAEEKTGRIFKGVPEVLAYAREHGRKVEKSKAHMDIRSGMLRRQNDGTFLQSDVDAYLKTLLYLGSPEGIAGDIESAAERQRRREEADIRKAEASAARDELKLAVEMGKYLPKDDVYMELAVRALALQNAIKNAFEAHCVEAINLVEGKARHADELVEFVGKIIDNALNEYSQPMSFDVEIVEEGVHESSNYGGSTAVYDGSGGRS